MSQSPTAQSPDEETRATRTRWAVTLGSTYFFIFAGHLLWTYLPRYFVGIGWSSTAIGTALGAMTIVRAVGQPVWAQISDARSLGSRVVKLQFVIGLLPLLALPFVESTLAVYAMLFAFGLSIGGVVPLIDTLTVQKIASDAFGRIRAFGSAGYGVAALAVGGLGLAWTHADIASFAPWAVVVLYGIAAIAAFAMPGSESSLKRYDWSQALRLLDRPWLLGLMGIWALHWAGQAPYNFFLVFLYEERGFGGWTPGTSIAVGICAEILVLWLSDRIFRRIPPGRFLVICMALTAFRWYATAETTQPWVAVGLQALHGFSFGGFLAAMMAILDREIPEEIRTTGQALLYVIVFGVGSAAGDALAGVIVDVHDAATSFRWAALLELAIIVPGYVLAARVLLNTSSPDGRER